MITGEPKSKIDAVWNRFWSGDMSHLLEVVEQITYLLFICRLDDLRTAMEQRARFVGNGGLEDRARPGSGSGRGLTIGRAVSAAGSRAG